MWKQIDRELLTRLPKQPGYDPEATWSNAAYKLWAFCDVNTVDDWDGQGAAAIPREVIDGAREFARALESRGVAAPGWIVPTYDSTLAFEWETADGTTVEIEVKAPRELQVTVKPRQGTFEVFPLVDTADIGEAAVR